MRSRRRKEGGNTDSGKEFHSLLVVEGKKVVVVEFQSLLVV